MQITQKQLAARIYAQKKQDWLLTNMEEQTTGQVTFDGGIRHEQSSEDGQLKPFWQIRRFDSIVGIYSSMLADIRLPNKELITRHLQANEYVKVKGDKIVAINNY